MGLAEAMTEARKRGLDLVEVNPAANPPVCKILDYGKYLYDLAKKEKDTKKNSSATKLKELNFHMNIDEHDYGVKMRHAEEFMWKGMKVKLQLKFRGREMMHQDIGMNLITPHARRPLPDRSCRYRTEINWQKHQFDAITTARSKKGAEVLPRG